MLKSLTYKCVCVWVREGRGLIESLMFHEYLVKSHDGFDGYSFEKISQSTV